MNSIYYIMKNIFLLLLLTIFSSCSLFGIRTEEEPSYQLLSKKDSFEIRQYDSYLIAKVNVKEENYKKAANKGFRILANYIFGDNKSKDKISMTAPVKQSKSIKIAMTAPVKQSKSINSWNISFVMPKKYTLDTLPLTSDKRIIFQKVKSKKIISYRFSGFGNEENIKIKNKELLKFIEKERLKIKSDLVINFYDPPWTIPFFKRNEIHYEIE